MKPMRLVNMSPGLRLRVQAAMDRGATKTRFKPQDKPTGKIKRYTRGGNGPNATEAEYNCFFLRGDGMYEAITLRLPGGSKYTPDWMSVSFEGNEQEQVITLTEVKGSHRFPSEGRSRLAFDVAKNEFPMFRFVWAKKTKAGKWEVEG